MINLELLKKKEKITVGIPQGLNYNRFSDLWITYFEILGIDLIISDNSTKKTLDEGTFYATDDTCLSMKIFMGHVKNLVGKCDYIFVPRIANFGLYEDMCTRYYALSDLVENTFKDSGQKFISLSIDVKDGIKEKEAFLDLGKQLGFPKVEALRAYKLAKKESDKKFEELKKNQRELFKKDGEKILIISHRYIIEDPYLGVPITKGLENLGAVPIIGSIVDRKLALKKSKEISPTCKWIESRELLGSIEIYKDKIDGIVIVTAFPCNLDSMVNEIINRKVKDIPILNLVLDGQSGFAGVETRLESFLDIIRFKEGRL